MRIIVSAALFSIVLFAKSEDFAHCELANQQLKLLNDVVDPKLRVRASQSLIQDIEDLRAQLAKNTTGLPDRLLRQCYKLKRKAFQAIFMKGGPALYGDYDFLVAAGKYFFYEKAWSTSHEAFGAAAKLKPTLFDPNYYALQAWIYTQLNAAKPLSEAAYRKQMKFYVENMLKAKDIKAEEKRLVLGLLATAENKSSKIYTARAMLESSVKMNPKDMKVRLQLGELEERAGRFADAKKIYEQALGATAKDPTTEKRVYINLLKLYLISGEKEKLKDVLKKALDRYPSDSYFRRLAKKN